jgi:hypothetical protein
VGKDRHKAAAGWAQFPDFPQDAGIFPEMLRAWKTGLASVIRLRL